MLPQMVAAAEIRSSEPMIYAFNVRDMAKCLSSPKVMFNTESLR